MKELNLHEEIIKSLSLMLYDRSLTLNEQTTPSDRLGNLKPIDKKDFPIYDPIADMKKREEEEDEKIYSEMMKTNDAKKHCPKSLNFCKQHGGVDVQYLMDTNTNKSVIKCKCKDGDKKILKGDGLGMTVNRYLEGLQKKWKDEWYIEAAKKTKPYYLPKAVDDTEFSMKSDRLGPYGEHRLDIVDPEERAKAEKERREKWKKTLSTWEQRLCDRAKKLCVDYGGHELFTHDFGSYDPLGLIQNKDGKPIKGFACGCKSGESQKVFTSGGRVITVNQYLRLGQVYTEVTYKIQDIVSDPHFLLMVGSIAMTLVTFGTSSLAVAWGSAITAGMFDFMDAALYIEEGDPFMAGLAAMFALIPFGELVTRIPSIKGWTKTQVDNFLSNVKNGYKLAKNEIELLELLSSKGFRVAALTKLFIVKMKLIVLAAKDINLFTKVLFWLVKKGYLTTKFLLKFGLMIGGVFYSWYKIAEILGIKEKGESINSLEETQEKLNNQTKDFTLGVLTEIKSDNFVLSLEKNKNFFSLPVLLIQFCLKAGGYDITNEEKAVATPAWEKRTPQGYINFNYDPKFDYLYKPDGKYELEKKRENWERAKKDILTKDFTKVKIPFKWGYFDENMKKMVVNYQKKNKLDDDGIIGQKTISSIISNLKSNKFNGIKNYSGHKLTTSEEESLFKKDLETQQRLDEKIELEQLQKAFEQQKEKLSADMERMINESKRIGNMTDEQINEMFKKLDVEYIKAEK